MLGGDKLKAMTVRLDDELYKTVMIKMIQDGRKFQEYVVELIKKDLEQENQAQDSNK